MNARILVPLLLLAGCGQPAPQPKQERASVAPIAGAPPAPAAQPLPPVEPIAPGQPGGLPDDRTPISEAKFTPESAQGAADVVQTYAALLESGRTAEGFKLWRDRQDDATAFAQEFARYREWHAQVGGPGKIEGAAGSSYVEVPIQAYGRMADGTEFHRLQRVTLRRTNDVPGSTAEQRLWRITSIKDAR